MELIEVRISLACLRQRFQPCEPDYIREVCHGRCCEGTGRILVSIHPSEQARIEAHGAQVQNGFLVPAANGKCPFKTPEGFCAIHENGQPLGCLVSPFTLNARNMLIVRNRYRCLRCYRSAPAPAPAYMVHRRSLLRLFGSAQYAEIVRVVELGTSQITALMARTDYDIITWNDRAKRALSHAT